ncbi:hypothetical protein QJS66_14225 [Kocuria rhizophila]|nr:hypothetical protein QJS66_14225 [Kocuria rhizophila]
MIGPDCRPANFASRRPEPPWPTSPSRPPRAPPPAEQRVEDQVSFTRCSVWREAAETWRSPHQGHPRDRPGPPQGTPEELRKGSAAATELEVGMTGPP